MSRGALTKQHPYSTRASVAALAATSPEFYFFNIIWISISSSPAATSIIQMKAASRR